ncbi:MAG TPA: glutamate--tRNA ligase [Candidatus Saccharimonadales bacterium]|nr:glutamate--tRNA ligase [Candidatus Saccharimonadales bacterium]
MSSNIRVRFAPSPTGLLHIGGVRTALFNYLFAQQGGGQFILRLEDTDQERFVPEGVKQIVEGLSWLSLEPDEGFWISHGKQKGIDYIQSNRHQAGAYQQWANKLVEAGLAYRSQIAPEKFKQLKAAAEKSGQPWVYRRTMEEAAKGDHDQHPIRVDVAAVAKKLGWNQITWRDEIRGEFETGLGLIEDFIIIKSDSYPTYNFANVIDDHDMKISQVIRGDEFIASTAKHVLLYGVFGWDQPDFIHLPVINGSDGKKLSKRTGDTDILEYRKQGYLAEAVINFLALLGWNPGSGETQEIFSRSQLTKRFSLERIQKSPAVFDPARLDWMNGEYIRAMKPEELLNQLVAFLGETNLAVQLKHDPAYSLAAIELIQERMKKLSEAQELLGFFFNDPDPSQLELPHGDAHKYLEVTAQVLSQNQDIFSDAKDLEKLMRQKVLEQAGADKPGPLFMAVRIAITGQTATPGLFETMVALGPETVLRRLKAAATA